MMEFLNWASEHPFLFVFLLMAISSVAQGIGRIGSTRVVHKKDD